MYVVIAQDIMVVMMFLFTYTYIYPRSIPIDSPPQLQRSASRQFVGYNVNNMLNIFQVVSLAVPIVPTFFLFFVVSAKEKELVKW